MSARIPPGDARAAPGARIAGTTTTEDDLFVRRVFN
jgi:hypothetical protein